MANPTSAKTGGPPGEPLRKELPRLARETSQALNTDAIIQRVHDRNVHRLQSGDIELNTGDTITRPLTGRRGLSVRRQLAGRRSTGGGSSY